ncbi:MAG: LacI family DNA-binding transcriptional regulator [Ktedonobacteraceae bacterium]|nr:LacI family DNA-binding transcriptional regulator [Ktedonobacteraceae bacterium]
MEYTIHDVARIAKVGIGTVSRVLNNNPNVKPATREKVLAVIAELHYKPNPIARSMISRRTNSIGVMIPFFTRPFHIEILRNVEAALHPTNMQIVLYNIETNAQRDAYFLDLPMRRRVDGLLVISLPVEDAVAQDIKNAGIPTVLLDTYNPLLTSLVVNNVEGAYQAVKCLIKKGHRHIGFINGLTNESNFKFNQANDRLIGFHRALGEAGLLFDPEMFLTSEWSREAGRATALQLLSHGRRPTAIFAASDIQAVGVLEAARSLNIRIPEELSLIGFDGIELSELLDFSTIQQPIEEMGFLSIQKLIAHIDRPETQPELIRLNTTLVERHTTAFSL